MELEYDGSGNLVHMKGGPWDRRYERRDGRLVRVTESGQESRSAKVDGAGRVVTLHTFDKDVTVEHDAQGHILSLTGLEFPTTFTYDAQDRIATETTGHLALTYTYDASGRLTLRSDGKGYDTSLEYDARGRLARSTSAFGFVTTYTYDERDRLTSWRAHHEGQPDEGVDLEYCGR